MAYPQFDYRLSSRVNAAPSAQAPSEDCKPKNRKSEAKKRWWAEKKSKESADKGRS